MDRTFSLDMKHEASLKWSKKGCLLERGSHSWVVLEQQRELMIAAVMNGSGTALAAFPIAVVKCPDKSNFSENELLLVHSLGTAIREAEAAGP